MAPHRAEPTFDQDSASTGRNAGLGLAPDPSKVLVVGLSQINRIVVSRIVERCGLRPVSETPQTAVRVLPMLFPAVVVLDGGAGNRDCDAALPGIVALRRISGRDVPAVILLSNRNCDLTELPGLGAVDAVVTKPFTPESLQPVVDRLAARVRQAG